MKKILTVILSATVSIAAAQWNDTNNNFEDSMHIPVSTALLAQKNPITLTSYPDGGYFVIWEDDRNTATTKTDIYAQKYDRNGNRLWAADGIPVCNGSNGQHYTFSSNQDYRNRSYAATDSAGGFYIAYSDDSVSSYYWERLMVQHVRSNGTGVFPSPGYLIATSNAANLNLAAQVIADGNKGFFVTWKNTNGNDYIYARCYRDENGTLKYYGGGRMNENAIQTSSIAPCGIKTDVIYPGTTVTDYNIWSDGQGGCNIIMNMNGNTLGQYKMLCYNRLWRAKKDSKTKTFFRNTSGAACPRISEYTKGDVYMLYTLQRDFQNVACGGGGGPVYTYTNNRLLSNGYQLIDIDAYDYNYPKGVNLSTTGNISADLIAVTRRTYANSILSDFTVQGYLYKTEIFDSLPYQRCSYNNPEIGFNPIAPASLNKLNFFRDTLLASSNYYPDFSLAAGGSHIYAAGLMGSYGVRMVRLQNLELSKKSSDSFALEYKTSIVNTPEKTGVAIGKELSTGFSGSDIVYDHPLVSINNKGKGLFYIREYYRGARVSPIGSGAELSWGAMGKPISTGVYNNSYYNLEQPVVTLDSTGASGFITWRDNKFIPGNSVDNIFMRHLDKLDVFNYEPAPKRVKLLTNPYGPTYANPAVLFGSSNKYTTLEVYDSYGNDPGTSPVADILDNNYLGRIQMSVFQNSAAIRRYNNDAYLNRNYTIKSDSMPPDASIHLLLYFTKTEFDALKGTDNTILNPGLLTVLRQPNTAAAAPALYAPVAGEELLPVQAWDSVSGGYYVSVNSTALGNFFIRKIATANICNAGGTSFSSNIAGATYQWQASGNNGVNYGNVSNNANYSGAAMATLQLTNIPASFNGYLYRCVVDNSKVSNTFYLQVANTWTGTVNNLWETAANWSCGTVPTAATDVIINSGAPTVNSTTAICRSIKLGFGASVNVLPGFKLTVVH